MKCALVCALVVCLALTACGGQATPDPAEVARLVDQAVKATIAAMPTLQPETVEVEKIVKETVFVEKPVEVTVIVERPVEVTVIKEMIITPAATKRLAEGAELGQPVLARGVGSNNRPIDITDTFSDFEDIIYCVVLADRIDAGTTFWARWIYKGEPFEDTPVITAEQDYSDTYIEFHIEPRDFGVLKSGAYACRIYVNGNPQQTVQFRVQ